MAKGDHPRWRGAAVVAAVLLLVGSVGYWLFTASPWVRSVTSAAAPLAAQSDPPAPSSAPGSPPAPTESPTPTPTPTVAPPAVPPAPVVTVPPLPDWQPAGGKVVYFTFDDGPDPKWTPQILSVLASYDAHATFFALGSRVSEHPWLVQRAVSEGHSVQNHSWDHTNFTKIPVGQVLDQQLKPTIDAITSAGGVRPTCVRPPEGARNADVAVTIALSGEQIALWTLDSRDWTRPGTKAIVDNVLKGVGPGSIILMHDAGGPDRSQTVAALKLLLANLSSRGYSFAAMCT